MKAASRVGLHALVLLCLFQLLRILFWWHNQLQFPAIDASRAISLLLEGVRFDLSTIAMTNGLIYLLYLAPWPAAARRFQRWLCVGLAFIVNAFSLGINLVDVEYYKFTGKRLTLDSFAIAQDINQQFSEMVRYYWFNSLLLLLLWGFLAWLCARLLVPQHEPGQRLRRGLIWIVTLALVVLAARGGWQAKPLIPAQAFAQGAGGRAGVISLNSTFTLLKSSQKASLVEKHYFPDAELKALLAPYRPAAILSPMKARPKNVVLVILESFGKEYVQASATQKSYAPFLHSLLQKGSSFELAFANGRRSIDALPAILAGVPAWMEPPYITSPYQTNQVIGLAQALKPLGVESTFYHGGKNGTMFFDLMAQQFGFDRYIGEREYPQDGDGDGQWGIFDEPFLQFVKADISKRPSPFLATIFTLSSHHPYRIPKVHQGRFPKGTLEIHESVGYADYALQQFYEGARREPWFADTLFIFTADHTSKAADASYETPHGRHAVPLLFILNDQALDFPDLKQAVQHVDIMPSILDILGLPETAYLPFGQSLLRPLVRPGVVIYEAETFHLLSPEKLLSFSPDEKATQYAWKSDLMLQKPEPVTAASDDHALTFLKAQIQTFNNGMVRDQLIW